MHTLNYCDRNIKFFCCFIEFCSHLKAVLIDVVYRYILWTFGLYFANNKTLYLFVAYDIFATFDQKPYNLIFLTLYMYIRIKFGSVALF